MTTHLHRATAAADELELARQSTGLEALQVRQLTDLTVRVADEGGSGTFEGWACRWDVVDSYGTTFAPGSFRAGGLDSDLYALLWMHSPWEPIGTFTAEERDEGLWLDGGWDATTDGQDKRAMAATSAPGLSVGFVPITVDPDQPERFTAVRLVETSQITRRMASVPGAAITASRIATPVQAAAATVAAAMLRLAVPPRVR